MYLQKIEIQGFKSFAKKTVLTFKKDITAVVGPNGSGKSNIADAMRWVLGEQSMQLLRSKKGDDVIFAGSESKGRLNMAEVSLYLNNEDRSLQDMEYSEIVLTRRVFRGGEGEYYINNSKVRLIDVILLLARANVGQKSYGIVGQGMIDGVLKSSSYDRRVFFDEATGVREYQIKRDKTVGKLGLTRDNLEQISLTLAELEPRMKMLSRQVKRLEEREMIEKTLIDLQTTYYSILWNGVSEQLTENFEASIKAQNEQELIKKDIETIESHLKEFSLEKKRSDIFDTIQNEYQRLQTSRTQLAQSLNIIQVKLESEYVQKGASDLGWLERRIQDLKESVRTKEFEHSSFISRLKEAENHLSELTEMKDQIYAQISEVKHHISIAESAVSNIVTLPKIKESAAKVKELQFSFVSRIESAETLDEFFVLRDDARLILDSVETIYKMLDADTSHEDKRAELNGVFEKLNHEKDSLNVKFADARVAVEVLQNKFSESETGLAEARSALERSEMELKASQITPENQTEAIAGLQRDRDHITKQIEEIDIQLLSKRKEIDELNAEEDRKREKIFTLQEDLKNLTNEFNKAVSNTNEIKIEVARLEQRKEDLLREIKQEMCLPEEMDSFNIEMKETHLSVDELKHQIQKTKARLQHIGGIDTEVTKEFTEVSERYTFLKTQSEDLNTSLGHLEAIVRELDVIIEKKFNENFKRINESFSLYFRQLFNGGKAHLKLVEIEEKKEEEIVVGEEAESAASTGDEEQTEEKKSLVEKESKLSRMGIEIVATPPGKKIMNISVLSGGEKTMTSIALICAIIATNPPPFVILDEVDAALDEANSDRFSDILQHLVSNTQFICITHNRAVMHAASSLYGVTMGTDGTSQLISLALRDAEKMAE